MATECHKKTSNTYILRKITQRLQFLKSIVVAQYDIVVSQLKINPVK